MSVPNCFEKVKAFMKKLGKSVPDETLREMAIKLSEMRAEALSPAEFQKATAELYADRLAKDAAARRAARLINLQKVEQARAVVMQPTETKMSVVEKVNAWILGNSRKVGNALNLSVHDMEKSLATGWLRQTRSILAKSGDLNVAESGLLAKEITQELSALERGEPGGASGSQQALRIAKAYNAVLAQAFEVKQAHDPFLGKILDYYYRATHDRTRISATPRDEWIEAAMATYGDNSFPEMTREKKIEAFANIYDQIVKGVYGSVVGSNPSDLMRRMAHSRTLIPNDWESFHNYNERFGRDNVHVSILRALESAAHDVAVIQKFGSMPEDTFKKVMEQLIEKGSKEDVELLKQNKQTIEDNFKIVTQKASSPATSQKARFFRGFMAVQQLAKNSTAFLRSWQDMANAATMITDSFGGNYLSNFVDASSTYVKYFGSNHESRLRAAEDMYLFSKSALHNLYQEFGDSAPITTRGEKVEAGLNKMLEAQSHISLMQRHISSMDAAMATILSRRLGILTETAYESLPKQVINGLKRYGIEKPQWEVLSRATEDWSNVSEPAMGRMDRVLNVDGVESIPDEVISNYVKETGAWKGEGEPPKSVIIRARSELASALGAMINQHADAASSTAGIAERAWMYGNTDINTWRGLALRMMFQFKSAIVKNYDTIVRSYYSNPAKPKGDFAKVARHAILSSGLWAMGETAKQLFEGKTPEDPLQPSFVAKAVLNSGAGGIIGDTVISEVARSQNASQIASGVVKGLAGPVVTTSADVLGILGQLGYTMTDSRSRFPGNALGRLITQNIPYQNLFYTKTVFNYYLANEIRDWLDPGFKAGLNRRVNQTPGLLGDRQEFFIFNPTE